MNKVKWITKPLVFILLILLVVTSLGCAQQREEKVVEKILPDEGMIPPPRENTTFERDDNVIPEEIPGQVSSDEIELLYDDGLDDALAELELLANLSE
ncbi:hypothetical protein HYW21_02235 [Candidatus Woesearchaeota archaeon]|nr:hypothetical protein [Candidatus Woesearchaeota archaeon]